MNTNNKAQREISDVPVPGVIGRFKTSHREALQNQPVGFMLVM
jgi:hypothetical protein